MRRMNDLTYDTNNQGLLALAQELLNLQDYDEMLDAVVRHSLSLLGGDRGFLVLVNRGVLDFKVIRNWSPDEYEGSREPISRSIVSEVLSQRDVLLIEDATQDPRFETQESIRELFIRSVLAAPILLDDKVAGALYLESRSMQRFFGEEERALFEKIVQLSCRVLALSLERLLLQQRNAQLERDLSSRSSFEGIVTKDESFRRILETVAQVAPSDLPVLLQGASGTGKELIARALHLSSARAKKPFLAINCGAISPTLLESELFGHTRGAFTGAIQPKQGLIPSAHSGTLFLDEVGELPKELQVKLLRVLQFGEVIPVGASAPQIFDVRFIAATNRDLEQETAEGRFREDLLYRLNAVTLYLPTLQSRPKDILPLFYHFLSKEAQRTNRPTPVVRPELEKALEAYHWPGNIRELENEARRLIALTPVGAALSVERLSARIVQKSPPGSLRLPPLSTLEEYEREAIATHVKAAQGNRTKAAETLGVTREGLRRMMKRHNLE